MAKTKVRYQCDECEKVLKNKRALVGHMWFAHGRRVGEKASLYDKIRTLESEPKNNPDVDGLMKQVEIALGELAEIKKDLLKMGTTIEELAHKDNPGDPKLKEVKPDEEDDDGLPDFFGKDKEDKTKKHDDDDSIFL